MSKNVYSILKKQAGGTGLHFCMRPTRYDEDDLLDLDLVGVWPEAEASASFRIEKFVGGGFAGQVYRCVAEKIDGAAIEGVVAGRQYSVKILVPPTRGRRRFRDFIYWLGFQGPFSHQVHLSAARSAALWRKLVKRAVSVEFGREDAVSDIYATFYDTKLGAYGQVCEWVEGRTWRLEQDTEPRLRKAWRDVDPEKTESPEYVAKRQFMYRFVKMLHAMGGYEFARQYEWWTMKSQPNVLKRADGGRGPGDGLCAIDFTAGLALLPYLPMSIGDVGLIFSGLMRGALVQFDRCDYAQLEKFTEQRSGHFEGMKDQLKAFKRYDKAYRNSRPDLSHHGWMLLIDRDLARDVRNGLIEGYCNSMLVDGDFAGRLQKQRLLFSGFYLLGAIPFLGRFCRRMWGNTVYRNHILRLCTDADYFIKVEKTAVAMRLLEWLRRGRVGEVKASILFANPGFFWIERYTLGLVFDLLPHLHRPLMEPLYAFRRIGDGWSFISSFWKDAAFREKWLADQVEDGYSDGMLEDEEKKHILESTKEPFIIKYLKSLAFHFATLPVTQIVSVAVAFFVSRWMLLNGASNADAAKAFVGILVLFQIIPISPGSLCRGFYVVYLMVREKNYKDYLMAAPIAFLKYLGYLAFPIQMVATYPELSRFMASRWATGAVKVVPVFGEKGALLEHMVFDLCFNRTRMFCRWAGKRIVLLLNLWMVLGLLLMVLVLHGCELSFTEKETLAKAVNVVLAAVVLFVFPRVLFYPIMRKKD